VTVLCCLVAAAASTAQAAESYVAGEGGWIADNAGSGLVALRTTLRIYRDRASIPGRLLALCTPTDERILFDPSSTGGIRSAEPFAKGTVSVSRDGSDSAETSWLAALAVFPNGSFQIADLPSSGRNVARTMITEVSAAPGRYTFRLSPLPSEARFEKSRIVSVQFMVGKADKASLDRFEASCKLLQRPS
jgi:hypothetical protein